MESKTSELLLEMLYYTCRRYLEVDDHYTKLYLVNITRGDAGVYKCFLDDTVTQEKSITLNIYRK